MVYAKFIYGVSGQQSTQDETDNQHKVSVKLNFVSCSGHPQTRRRAW